MPDRFPHMSDTEFPDVQGVDVWKLKNDFPYKEFDNPQMRITVCKVPWDVGLIHVGNAQIGGLGNVVDFGSETARDAWFETLTNKHVFETEYRAFHMQGASGSIDGSIKLPIPYDVMAAYNYAIVEYYPLPVALEGMGVNKWFYFIRESHMKASNTTEVELILDAWQTFLPGVELRIPYMMLERGHAPMAALSADDFLENPMENTRYVTGDDVTFDDIPGIVRHDTEIVFNDGETIYACFIVDSVLTNSWGEYRNTWRMPRSRNFANQGTPNYACVCLPTSDFSQFILDIDNTMPQFKQSVKAIFFASEKMMALGTSFDFAGRVFHYVSASQKRFDFLELTKDKFGYDSRYANIAKLYTYPYARIEITDENGETSIVRIEDTSGKLDIVSSLSTVFPYLHLTANVLGIGSNDSFNVSFKNISSRAMRFGGRWQTVSLEWDIPTFAVVQSNDITYDYSTWYDRVQAKNDADTAKADANASAATAKTNADAIATTDKSNADAVSSTEKTNADSTAATIKTNADNSAATAQSNTYRTAAMAKTNADADANTLTDNVALDVTANNSNSSNRQSLNNQSTATDNASNDISTSLGNSLTNALTSISTAAERESAGVAAIGGYIGAALSLSPSQAVGTTTSLVQSGISIHASQAEASAQTSTNSTQLAFSKVHNNTRNLFANAEMGFETATENTRITGQAANSAATAKANATREKNCAESNADATKSTENVNAANVYDNDTTVNSNVFNTDLSVHQATYNTLTANNSRTKTTADENAQRDYDNALAAIENDIKQAALKPTNTFGSISNAEHATTRPMAAFAQIVTQSDGAIVAAGDEMLRFGYHCNMQWEFDGWQKMRNFTYWKVSDLWFDDFNLPDAYADRIRFMLMGGVCVWRSPDIIGKTSIYDN